MSPAQKTQKVIQLTHAGMASNLKYHLLSPLTRRQPSRRFPYEIILIIAKFADFRAAAKLVHACVVDFDHVFRVTASSIAIPIDPMATTFSRTIWPYISRIHKVK